MCTAPISRLWRSGGAGGRGPRSGSSPRDRGWWKIFLFGRKREKRSKHTLLAEAGLDPATVGYEPSTLSTAPLRCRYNIRHQSDVDYNGPTTLSRWLSSSPYIASSLSLSPLRRPYQVVPCVHSARALVACSSSAPRPSRHDVSSLPALCIANALRSRACMASVNGASFAASRLCSSITLVSCRDGEGAPCWST